VINNNLIPATYNMCGIYGCIGNDAATQVLEGLRKLEYRGYDSAGLGAIFPEHAGPIITEKAVGYVSNLVSKANGRFQGAKISIGHTRWATHGRVTYTNAHPHSNDEGNITLVHNGIIENAMQLSNKLVNLGYNLESETDTEVIVHLMDFELKQQDKSINYLEAFENVISHLKGSWALALIISDMNGILISRSGAPLLLGRNENNISISSDVQPFYGSCSEIAYIEDGDTLLITNDGIFSKNDSINPVFLPLDGVYNEQDSGLYPDMMLKEIHDQPISLSNVLGGRISADGSNAKLSGFNLSPEKMKKLDRINFVGCGTAYYAAAVISSYVRKYTSITTDAFRASEFPASYACNSNTLTVGISQSGETKDTLDALINAKKYSSHIGSFCNVIGSTIARFTGNGAYLYAGPEFAVASTKVFTNMIASGLIFALTISDKSIIEQKEIIMQLRKIPNLLAKMLSENIDSYDDAVEIILNNESAIFIGRGTSSFIAQEGALKMMEVAYIPCISLPGGELKHGVLALIESGTPVVVISPSDSMLNLMESSIRECKARGAKIILITDSNGPITKLADALIQTPSIHDDLYPFVNTLPLQLLAYKVGIKKGINVDRPRNLAKSVTVV
jgi:glutamine---fructose-6-phosphate transaminase (isomerizing)